MLCVSCNTLFIIVILVLCVSCNTYYLYFCQICIVQFIYAHISLSIWGIRFQSSWVLCWIPELHFQEASGNCTTDLTGKSVANVPQSFPWQTGSFFELHVYNNDFTNTIVLTWCKKKSLGQNKIQCFWFLNCRPYFFFPTVEHLFDPSNKF